MNIVIGVDPDSEAHGVAIYREKELIDLSCMPLMEFMGQIKLHKNLGDNIKVIIENVKANKGTFAKSFVKNAAASKGVAQGVGMCKQSQSELERMLDHLGIEYKLMPISKAWKKDKKQFELVTGWTGRSNEDTRSAAYFGWLGLK